MQLIKAAIAVLIFMICLLSDQLFSGQDHTQGRETRKGLKFLLELLVPFPITYSNETAEDMQELGVEIRFVDEMPYFPEAESVYEFDTGIIYLKKFGNRFASDMIVAHEITHYLRHQNGLWTGDRALEETIACMLRGEFVNELFDQNYRITGYKKHLEETLKINNIKDFSVDLDVVEVEKEKTRKLFKELLKKRR